MFENIYVACLPARRIFNDFWIWAPLGGGYKNIVTQKHRKSSQNLHTQRNHKIIFCFIEANLLSEGGFVAEDTLDGVTAPNTPEPKNPDVIRDNAPRIVGAMKFIPDIFLFLSGLKDTGKAPFRSAAAIGFMGSRSLLLAFGSKDRKKDAPAANAPDKDDPSLFGRLKYNFYKITHPGQYPVESAAGVAALAGVSVALSGAAQMRQKSTFWEGMIELGVGIFTALAEGNVLFSKEKAKPSQDSSEVSSTNKSKSLLQTLKDQPVLLSGITQAAISGSQIGLGVMTLVRSKKNAAEGQAKSWYYLAAASIYTAADLVYAFLVRKNDFNVEAKTPKAEQKPETAPSLPPKHSGQGKLFAGKPPKASWEASILPSSAQDTSRAIA